MRFGSRGPSKSFVSDALTEKAGEDAVQGLGKSQHTLTLDFRGCHPLKIECQSMLGFACGLFEEIRYLVKPSTKKKGIKLISVIGRLPCRKAG